MTEQIGATEDQAVKMSRILHKGKSYSVATELLDVYYSKAEAHLLLAQAAKDSFKNAAEEASADLKVPADYLRKLFNAKFKDKLAEQVAALKNMQEILEAMDDA